MISKWFLDNYIAFHSIIEVLSIVIGFSIYSIAKDTYKVSKNSSFMFLGTAFLAVSVTDLFHAISFDNSTIMLASKYNISIQFYLAARYMQVVTFFIFSIIPYKEERKIRVENILISYYLAAFILFLSVAFLKVFPKCYVQDIGLTQFKVISDYIICIIYLAIMIILVKNHKKRCRNLSNFLLLSIKFSILSQLFFASYKGYSDFLNIFGHIFKLISFYMLYKAIVETTLKKPYDTFFYKLTDMNSHLELRTKELEKINKKLNESKKRYQELLDFLPYAIFTHSDGKFVFVNNAALGLLNIDTYSDILGRDVLEYIHPDYHDIVKQRMDKVYNKNEITDLTEIKMLTKHGQSIDVEIKSVPYVYREQKASLAVAGDIRERKDAEEKKKALKEAKEYDRIKNEFMANISHELRTPLNVIFGAVQLIEYYAQSDSLYENRKNVIKYSKSMRQNCYRMLRLVNNLIDLTKIDAGFMSLKLQNNNIVSIVEDITLSVAQYIESKNISIEFDTEVEERYIACDADIIERIMLNLLSNAVKFTKDKGSIWVDVYDEEKYVLIKVKDTGIGIPKDKQDMIFDRFRQVDKSLTRNTEGSGIGLSLVKSLVELHGGCMHLKSKVGEGSEFIVILPATLKAEDDEVAATTDMTQEKVERIHIEFSDIYS